MMSADFDPIQFKDEPEKKEYRIKLYGPFLNQNIKLTSKENMIVELMHYAPMNSIKKEFYLVQIKSLSMPLDFITRNN